MSEIIGHGYFNPTLVQSVMLQTVAADDYYFAWSMKQVAHEIRERQYAALERLALLMSAEPGSDVEERMAAALAHNLGPVAGCLLELGWIDEEPIGCTRHWKPSSPTRTPTARTPLGG